VANDFFDVKEEDSSAPCMMLPTLRYYSIKQHRHPKLHFYASRKRFCCYSFYQDSVFEFFDPDGTAFESILESPLDFFRITSRFTNSRFHPILNVIGRIMG
jgi:hypothetical protein